MTVETVPFESATYPTLTYSRIDFPVAVLDGKPWWSTAHIQHHLNSRFMPVECDCFTPLHVGGHRFPFDADDGLSHVVSTLAGLELAGRHPSRRANKMVAGWLRKRDAELRTVAPETTGSLFRVDADGPFPGKPFYSGPLGDEWTHWCAEYERRFSTRAPRTPMYF